MKGWLDLVVVFFGLGALMTGGSGVLFLLFVERETWAIGLFLCLGLLALGAAQGAIVVGLTRRRPWARTAAIAVAAVALVSGAGTLPALVTIFVLLHADARAMFTPPKDAEAA